LETETGDPQGFLCLYGEGVDNPSEKCGCFRLCIGTTADESAYIANVSCENGVLWSIEEEGECQIPVKYVNNMPLRAYSPYHFTIEFGNNGNNTADFIVSIMFYHPRTGKIIQTEVHTVTLNPLEYTSETFQPMVFDEIGEWDMLAAVYSDTTTLYDYAVTKFLVAGPDLPIPLPAGNPYLFGDVNFDGVVNLEDVNMIASQIGRNEYDFWGTCTNCYNPNADLDFDGEITVNDLDLVNQQFGSITPRYCATRNPTFIDNGAYWEPKTRTDSYLYFVVPINFGQIRANTKFLYSKRGWEHYIDLNNFVVPWITKTKILALSGTAFTAATIGNDFIPDRANPQPSPYDIPLNPDSQEFFATGQIDYWEWTLIPRTWMTYMFGTYIILEKPYTLVFEWTETEGGAIFTEVHYPRIIELMFAMKDSVADPIELWPQPVPIGGDDWHKIYGNAFLEKPWFLTFQHIMDDPPVGTLKTWHLPSDTFSRLIQRIQELSDTDENVLRNVPTPVISLWVNLLVGKLKIYDLDFTNAKIRPAYIGLQGKADAFSIGYFGAHTFTYGFGIYDTKKGIMWRSKLSGEKTVTVE
jgi:hypothetical protein